MLENPHAYPMWTGSKEPLIKSFLDAFSDGFSCVGNDSFALISASLKELTELSSKSCGVYPYRNTDLNKKASHNFQNGLYAKLLLFKISAFEAECREIYVVYYNL